LQFRARCGAEPALDDLLKAWWTEAIVERLFDPCHLLLVHADLSAPATILAAGKDVLTAFAHF
jgi:hypothetical protein